MGNVPWDGMAWDRHKLLWDGNGTDKYVPWTTLGIPVEMVQFLLKVLLKHGFPAVNHDFH